MPDLNDPECTKDLAEFSFSIGKGSKKETLWNGITNAPSSLESDKIEANVSTKNFNPVAIYVKKEDEDGSPLTVRDRIELPEPEGNIVIKNEDPGIIL